MIILAKVIIANHPSPVKSVNLVTPQLIRRVVAGDLFFPRTFKLFDYRMLKRRSQSTDIAPLVNSAVDKLQELGTDLEISGISLLYFAVFRVPFRLSLQL